LEAPDLEQRPEQDDTSSSSSEPVRTEDILLERLKAEAPVKPQLPPGIVVGIVIVVIAVGVIISFISRTPDKFAENPHAKANEQAAADSAAMYSKRMKLQPMVDSLAALVKAHPDDNELRLQYANALYEGNFWDEALPEYEAYVKANPKAVDARIDYAYVIAETSHDFARAVSEIDKALAIDPNHIKGLFNAGLLAVQANPDRKIALAKSESYFRRARAAALKQGDQQMLANIDQILAEIEKVKNEKSDAPPSQ
jgi:tetratricopeptide (TPR) repeat protein